MNIAAIIVAAGSSSRFEDGNKLLADFKGRPVIRHVAAAVEASLVSAIVLVTAGDGDAVLTAAGKGRWQAVKNPRALDGLSASIQCGLAALSQDIDGAMIVLADMPAVTPDLIAKLCAAFKAHNGEKIVFPQTDRGHQGNPVLWPRALFAELMHLTGDTGGKALLAAHPELQMPVIVTGDAATFDVDTVSDLERGQR